MRRRSSIPRWLLMIPLLSLLAACGGGGGGSKNNNGNPVGTSTCVWGSSNWGGCSWGS